MDPLIAPDRLELADAVRAYLADTHGPETLRRLDADGKRDPAIWEGLVALGLPGMLVPEAQGGMGLGMVDAAVIARECGRAALAEPLVESAFVMVPWLLARGETQGLAAVAAGQARPLPAHRINGWQSDGEGAPLESIDPLRHLAALPDEASDDPLLLDLGALMAASQLIGVGEAMLDQAIAYARLREQFGQPIGAFQAIKHKLADVAVALEFARPVLWRAAQAIEDRAASMCLHVSHAKVAATDAAYLAAESAIQVHGAMGYTYEVDLHFWMKRTWALGGAWGSRGFHIARIGQAIIGGTHPLGPRHTYS